MSFDIQRHPEDFEEFEIYNSMEKYMEEIVAANKAFTSGIKQLIGYKRISTVTEYRAAVYESYEEADETMKDLLEIEGITPYKFCKDLGFSQGYLDKRGAIGTDKYLKIIKYLSDYNPMWILNEEPPMMKLDIEINIPDQ